MESALDAAEDSFFLEFQSVPSLAQRPSGDKEMMRQFIARHIVCPIGSSHEIGVSSLHHALPQFQSILFWYVIYGSITSTHKYMRSDNALPKCCVI
jgi:hypothetical protein